MTLFLAKAEVESEADSESCCLEFPKSHTPFPQESMFPHLTCSLGLKLVLSCMDFSPQGIPATPGDILDGHDRRDATGI